MSDRFDVVVIGAGQAGLSVSFELSAAGVSHVVLERGRVGETWRGHWESFCLVTPNWGCRLPGHPYDGPDPDGFMPRDEIVAYLEALRRALRRARARGRGGDLARGGARRRLRAGDLRRRAGHPRRGGGHRGLPAAPPARGRRPRSRPSCSSSTCPTTARPASCRRARCWWWAVASRARRSPRSSTRPAAMSSSPADAPRGCRAGSVTTTCSGGRSRPGSWTSPSPRSRRRATASARTCWPAVATAGTTCTCARCTGWA